MLVRYILQYKVLAQNRLHNTQMILQSQHEGNLEGLPIELFHNKSVQMAYLLRKRPRLSVIGINQ